MFDKAKLVIFDRITYISTIILINFLTTDLIRTHYLNSIDTTVYIFASIVLIVALIYSISRLKDLIHIYFKKVKCTTIFKRDRERFIKSKEIFKIKLAIKAFLFLSYLYLYFEGYLTLPFLMTLSFVIITPDIYRHYKFKE
jgi:hypothetical protein